MHRTVLLSTLLLVSGLHLSQAYGQDDESYEAHRRPTIGERFEQFRRSILGDGSYADDDDEDLDEARAERSTRQRRAAGHERVAAAPRRKPEASSRERGSAHGRPAHGSSRRRAAGAPQRAARERARAMPEMAGDEEDEEQPVRAPRRAVRREQPHLEEDAEDLDEDDEPRVARRSEEIASDDLEEDDGDLFTQHSPTVSISTSGPRRIVMGRAAAYKVIVINSGDMSASDLVVTISVPTSAEVQRSQPSSGTTRTSEEGAYEWLIPRLGPQSQQELTLDIVPHESKPFELGVRWESAPIESQMTVEVQEPKLRMSISGPREVEYGKDQIYTLTLSNPGNGDATNVAVRLMPLEPGDHAPGSHRIGTLRAGENKVVEIELTARQSGKLSIQAEATADHGLTASATRDVNVNRAEIQVSVTGPQTLYAGIAGDYTVTVSNPGNATARHVKVDAILPDGSEYVGGSASVVSSKSRSEAHWTLNSLPPGAQESFTLKCKLGLPGQNSLEAHAAAEGGAKGEGSVTTKVTALADLTLDVSDPSGPVPLGQTTTYEIHIGNRGTSAAEGVDVLVYFSDGIEPISVDGGAHEITPGMVTLETIPSIGPGEEIVYRVEARSDTAGSHRCRVELECKVLQTHLSQEETTLFLEANGGASAESQPASEASEPSEGE